METETTPKVSRKVKSKTEGTDQKKLVGIHGLPNQQAQSSDSRMDKLL